MDKLSPLPRANTKSTPPLRVGLLLNSVTVSQSLYDFTQWAQSHPNITVTHLILHARPATELGSKLAGFLKSLIQSAKRNGLYFFVSKLTFCILELLERQRLKRDKQHSGHVRNLDLSPLVKDTIVIMSDISEPGLACQIDAADIQKIKDLKFDLLLTCGRWTLSGGILNASKFGIISLQHGDDQTNRGGPAGFWEVYLRQDTTGFTIRRLTEDPSAGDVFMRGRFATRHYYMLNQAFILRKSIQYLKIIVEQIGATGRLPDILPNLPYSHKLFRAPGVHEIGIYAAKIFSTIFMKRIWRLLDIDYRWNVAFVHKDWRNTEFQKGIKLKQRPFHSLADPFVISKNGSNYCFVEDLDHLKNRGSIAVYELADAEGTRLGTALEEDFHLSFPYLFEFQGELYMCPESSENNDIRIYKCVEFPLRWKLEKIVMERISATDTMIFERGEKWWMLTNIDPAGIGDYCSELFIFSSNSPFDSDWKPHPLNPIVVDASRARNAGCVIDGDRYFRFSQGQGFDFYGRRLVINEIIELTDTGYRESCLSVATPSFGGSAVGMHHLHSNGRITVFDFAVRTRIKN